MKDFTRYIPHTGEDIQTMLEFVGAKKIEDLFEMIPEACRLSKPLTLPEPLAEPDLLRQMQGLQSPAYCSFLGAGAYYHFIPSVTSALISRSEFYTAYTPYSPRSVREHCRRSSSIKR